VAAGIKTISRDLMKKLKTSFPGKYFNNVMVGHCLMRQFGNSIERSYITIPEGAGIREYAYNNLAIQDDELDISLESILNSISDSWER
jgi:hypothetical protein